ncbi:uncharacterized protein LOC143488708 [Brachyhypopomus gauderio]|uniref:uncharacterized protein LOC143488708 n=1 Tax=Brachyhypopomus gauderio TaxID=698409 RepID=UPI0040425B86
MIKAEEEEFVSEEGEEWVKEWAREERVKEWAREERVKEWAREERAEEWAREERVKEWAREERAREERVKEWAREEQVKEWAREGEKQSKEEQVKEWAREDEMRATVIDHVIVHGMTMTEAGQRVQPNLSRFSVATIIRAFREHNRVERLPFAGGRPSRFTPAQEVLIVDMVRENNMIRLREIQERIIGDNVNFQNIDNVSLTTIDRVLKCQRVRMKQAYRVPFERNSDRIKHLRHQYVQRIFELESMARPQEFIFVDEAGFNLNKRRRRGRNIIGWRAIVDVPGQRGGNITLCAAMSSRGLLHRHAELGAYNTERLLTFLGELRDVLHNNDLFLMRSCGPTQPDDVMPPNDFSVNIQHTVSIYNLQKSHPEHCFGLLLYCIYCV